MKLVKDQRVKMSSEGCFDEHQEPSSEIHEQNEEHARFT